MDRPRQDFCHQRAEKNSRERIVVVKFIRYRWNFPRMKNFQTANKGLPMRIEYFFGKNHQQRITKRPTLFFFFQKNPLSPYFCFWRWVVARLRVVKVSLGPLSLVVSPLVVILCTLNVWEDSKISIRSRILISSSAANSVTTPSTRKNKHNSETRVDRGFIGTTTERQPSRKWKSLVTFVPNTVTIPINRGKLQKNMGLFNGPLLEKKRVLSS